MSKISQNLRIYNELENHLIQAAHNGNLSICPRNLSISQEDAAIFLFASNPQVFVCRCVLMPFPHFSCAYLHENMHNYHL